MGSSKHCRARVERGTKREGAAASAAAAAKSEPRASLYDDVTNRIISELEAGRFPWVQPWGNAEGGEAAVAGLPRNALTGRNYSGVNILILWGAVIERAYPSQSWLTFKQALDAGGCVRKGEQGTTVVYADRFIPKGEAEKASQSGDDPKAVPFLKRFTVLTSRNAMACARGLLPIRRPLPSARSCPSPKR